MIAQTLAWVVGIVLIAVLLDKDNRRIQRDAQKRAGQ